MPFVHERFRKLIEAVPKRKLQVDLYLNGIDNFTRFSFLSVCDGDKIANYSLQLSVYVFKAGMY